MPEEEKTEPVEEEQEEKDAETDESPANSIDDANIVIEKMKKENDRREQLTIREEKMHVQNILSGRANAGQPQVKKKEQTPREYADMVLRGEHPEKEKN